MEECIHIVYPQPILFLFFFVLHVYTPLVVKIEAAFSA